MGRDDDTLDSFPTYADLTVTKGWSGPPVPVSAFDDTAEIDAGEPRYAESALLGAGGMGKVMLARDARIGREVAVKQLHADRELTADDRARFLREARVQGQLEHPSIVPVYDIDRHADGTTFFTMRRVVGRTLHAILEALRTADPAAVTRYTQRELLSAFATVCLTIDYAHSRGVIHRDIKPANIMLGDFGEVYVLDWGLARLLDDAEVAPIEHTGRLSTTGELLGTPLYMAPEQMADPRVGPAADVFALGAILFEILTLQRLRDAKTLFLPAEARPSVRDPNSTVAPELETICVRATQSDERERYPTARAVQEAVVRYLEGDRETAERRRLALERATKARTGLAHASAFTGPDADAQFERARTSALRNLGRAISLEPDNASYQHDFAQIWSEPPRVVPQPVRDRLAENEQKVVRAGAQTSIYANLIWFVFLPIAAWMGIRHWGEVALIFIPAAISILLAVIAARWPRRIPGWLQLALVSSTMFGMAAISRTYGPLVLTPLMITVFIIVMQAHPARWFRRACWLIGTTTLIAPVVLELLGVLPSSYMFDGGRMVILPQVHELPQAGSVVMLLAAYLGCMFVPGIFINSLRVTLNEQEVKLQTNEWHYKRLGGELIQTAGAEDAPAAG